MADLGTKPLSKAVTLPHTGICQHGRRKVLGVNCTAEQSGHVNMVEGNVLCKRQDVAMFWDFGSIHMIVTGGSTVQHAAGDHVKTSSRAVRNSSN